MRRFAHAAGPPAHVPRPHPMIPHNPESVEGAALHRVAARARDRGMVAGIAVGAAVALVAWPVRTLAPGISGDWGWVATLSYAAHHGLRFGEQIVWNYGPLGYLNTWYGPTLYYSGVLLASWLFAAIVQLLLAGTLLAALRRSMPLWLAALVAAVVLAPVRDRALALGFAWCALAVARPADASREAAALAPRDRALAPPLAASRSLAARAFPIAIGALTAVALLGKFNQGGELLLLALVALAASARRRDLLAFPAALLTAAAIGWFASGQTLAGVWPYLRYGYEIVAGYPAAMGRVPPAWTYAAAVALVALALALAWRATRGGQQTPRSRWALLALCAIYLWFNFREGFTRADPEHQQVFFADALVLFAVLPLGTLRAPRRPRLRPVLAGGGIAVALAALAGLTSAGHIARTLDPFDNAKAAADQVRTLASPARQAAITADLRARTRALYQLTPRLRAAIGRRPTMLWPFDYGEIAYAYDLTPRPLPSLEPFVTYTRALDRLGARMLAGPRAPARVVRAATANAPGIDNRYATFEAPATALQILCRYRQIAAQEPWHVLARAPDRCGAPRTFRRVAAPWGAAVAVPPARRPEALVLARVDGTAPQGLERLRALLLRPHARWIALDGTRYRLVAETAVSGLLLRAPRAADYPAPFAMAPNPARIAVGRDGGEPGGRVRYTFVEVPIRRYPR